jgi:hypothetical protein
VLTLVQMDTIRMRVLVSYVISHARLAQVEISQQTVFLAMAPKNIIPSIPLVLKYVLIIGALI